MEFYQNPSSKDYEKAGYPTEKQIEDQDVEVEEQQKLLMKSPKVK